MRRQSLRVPCHFKKWLRERLTQKVSKAQKEVWEWKEAVYEDIKNLSQKERIEFFGKRSDKIIEKLGLEKVKVRVGVYQLKKKKVLTVGEEKVKYGKE